MKILFFLHSFPKISETFIIEQATGLIDNKIDIRIIAERKPPEPFSHPVIKKYNLGNITAYYDDYNYSIRRITASIKSFVNLFGFDYKTAFSIIKKASLKDILLLDCIIKSDNYDVIHAHFGTSGILISDLKERKLIRHKLITSFHGYDLTTYLKNKTGDSYAKLMTYGDIFLPVNNYLKEKLVELGFPSNRIIVHRMGINPEKFIFSEKQPSKTIKLLTVARLIEKKGLYYSIKALKNVISSSDINIEYNIIGDGILKRHLSDLIRKENMSDIVKLHGWKDNDEVIGMMNDSHIYILPSLTADNGDMEGTPVSIMEAMACGMPVVSTYHSGIPELVNDGESGLLAKEKDIDDLTDKLRSILKTPEKWPSMGREGREKIETDHDVRKLNLKLIDIYNKLLYNS